MRTAARGLPAYTAPRAAAQRAHYALPMINGERRTLAMGWLFLALGALVLSGVFSVLLVLARTPGLQRLFPVADFFHVALVVHVDLSVLVWFASMAGVLWTLNSGERRLNLGRAALVLAGIGATVMAASAYFGRGRPVMSNYVPVLDDALFLYGLFVFGIGFALLVLRGLIAPAPIDARLDGAGALRFGLNASVVAAAIALAALVWSWAAVPSALDGKTYYELLFWGSGHAIQFTWTLLMLVAWLWLATLTDAQTPLTPRVAVLLFTIALASVFAVPLIYYAWDVTSVQHRTLHTWLMRFGGGLAILPVAAAVTLGIARAGPSRGAARPLRAALMASLTLFALGGVVGFLIRGSDVRIPAHYHGEIVGVTLALMGIAYALLPRFGYRAPEGRLAVLQPYLYGSGQLLHVLGLVWSGGYGVQRKVAGTAQVLHGAQEVLGMALMGAGGLVAVAGGLLFIVVCVRAIAGARAAEELPCA
jgi:cytochrome c oxidase subunit I